MKEGKIILPAITSVKMLQDKTMGALEILLDDKAETQADIQLLHRVAAGEESALHELYALYGRSLYAFALRLSGDPQTAEEVLQESLIAVWQGAHRFRGEGRAAAWLLSIVRNKALSALRRLARQPADNLPSETPSLEPAPQRQFDHRQQSHLLRDGMQQLSLEHRTVLELVFYQGLSLKEVAQVCDCPVGTVKSRLNYAKERLRGVLQRQGLKAEELI